jgi:hypothetical protein
VFTATVGHARTVARRVSPAGVLVDAAPFDINNNPAGQFAATAATDGSTTLVTWYDYRSGSADIYGARVQGATILDGVSTGFPISTATGPQYTPRVTFGAGNFLVVWEDQRGGGSDVYGTRVSPSATVLDGVATGIALAAVPGSDQRSPWPASNGSGYFVAWEDTRNTATAGSDIYGTRMSAAGVVSDPAGIQICNNGNHQFTPSVAFGGGNYQVVWQEGTRTGLYGNRVTTAGALLDGPAGAQITSAPLVNVRVASPQISVAGAGFYLAWSEFPNPATVPGGWRGGQPDQLGQRPALFRGGRGCRQLPRGLAG